jgi:hypothetical protein
VKKAKKAPKCINCGLALGPLPTRCVCGIKYGLPRIGSPAGGLARSRNMTPEARKKAARWAAKVRWGKVTKTKKPTTKRRQTT